MLNGYMGVILNSEMVAIPDRGILFCSSALSRSYYFTLVCLSTCLFTTSLRNYLFGFCGFLHDAGGQ